MASTIERYGSDAVERALACLEASRKVDNPAGYLLAALKQGWSPPASFLQARARKAEEQAARRAHLAAECERIARRLGTPPTEQDLAQEAEGCLEAEQERRRLFGRGELAGAELESRREQIRARVRRQWQEDADQLRRRQAALQGELTRLRP